MPFDSFDQAVRRASDQTYAVNRSVRVTSDGDGFFVEGLDPDWRGFEVVMTVVPTFLARRA